MEINDLKEDLEEANISTNKDTEKELEYSTEDSTKEENDSVQVFSDIELSKISNFFLNFFFILFYRSTADYSAAQENLQ